MYLLTWFAIGIVVGFGIWLLSGITIIYQHERGIKYRLGKMIKQVDPGLHFIFRGIEKIRKYSMRNIALEIPRQSVISQDSIPIEVSAVVYFRISDPKTIALKVENYRYAISQLAQVILLSVIGEIALNELLGQRKKVTERVRATMVDMAKDWGIEIGTVSLKDIEVPRNMKRILASCAEAERTKKAQLITADGEIAAAKKLKRAARELSSPEALQLRLYQNFKDIAKESRTTTILPIPIRLFSALESGIKQINHSEVQSKRR